MLLPDAYTQVSIYDLLRFKGVLTHDNFLSMLRSPVKIISNYGPILLVKYFFTFCHLIL